MGNLFKKAKSAASDYVGSVSGDANAIGSKIKGKLGSLDNISNTFDQRIADGLSDLLTGVTGIRTSNIPEINDAVMQAKSANREARAAVLNNAMAGRKGLAEADPPKGIPLKYPANFAIEDGTTGEMTNYMHFRSLQRRSHGSHDGKEEVYDIFLYVPDEVADAISVTYTESEKGLVEGAISSLFTGKNEFASWSEIKEIVKAGMPGGDILKAAAGKTINPLAFQLFEGVTMRSYSYNFEFMPLNENDSKTIRHITYAFRKSMLPGTDGANSRIYTFPNEWAIRYHGPIKQWVDYPMVTVCTEASVDWASSGEFSHHLDGAPTTVKLSLSFVELTTLDRTKFDERVSGFIHGMDGAREASQEGGSKKDVDANVKAGEDAKKQAEDIKLKREEEERAKEQKVG